MMRRLAAVTVTALLSAAALTAGADAARASGAGQADPTRLVHLLGSLHLKRVDTLSGQTHTAYLVCTSTPSTAPRR